MNYHKPGDKVIVILGSFMNKDFRIREAVVERHYNSPAHPTYGVVPFGEKRESVVPGMIFRTIDEAKTKAKEAIDEFVVYLRKVKYDAVWQYRDQILEIETAVASSGGSIGGKP